jgi:hypothetical protein
VPDNRIYQQLHHERVRRPSPSSAIASLDLYLVALISFGLLIFNNLALIRRHFV